MGDILDNINKNGNPNTTEGSTNGNEAKAPSNSSNPSSIMGKPKVLQHTLNDGKIVGRPMRLNENGQTF